MRKVFGRIGYLALAASFVFAALVNVSQSKADEVKVGAILSIEGIFSSVGVPEREGIELAVEQINAAGGVGGKTISLTVYDDAGDQAKAVQLANRLIFQDKVSVVFGPTITPTGEMITPIFEQNGVLEVGFIAQDYTWVGTKYIFMALPGDSINAESMVRFAAQKTGAKNMAVAFANVPYGVNGNKFIQEFADPYNIPVVATEKWGETDIDFTAQANRIKQSNPEAILLWGSCAVADSLFIKALREAGVNAPLVGNLCLGTPQTPEIAGKAAEGTVAFSVINYAKPDAETQAFLGAYSEKFGHYPIPFAATAYDGVYLWAKAVERAGGKTDSDSVAEAMIGTSYKGVSGQFNVTKENHHGLTADAYKPMVLKDGEWASM